MPARGKRTDVQKQSTQDSSGGSPSKASARTVHKPQSLIGLYYPYWVFWEEDWLKLTALYWDKIARVVPAGMDPIMLGDEETAQVLQDELGFIVNLPFSTEVSDVSAPFIDLIRTHETELSAFRVAGKLPKGTRDPAVTPTYLWEGEMTPELVDALLAVSFAKPARNSPGFLEMHPKLAVVYKQALAESMAATRQMSPLTSDVLFHVAVSGCTPERLAQGLLDGVEFASAAPSSDEVTQEIATLALQSVIPRDLQNVPIEKIVKVRKQHAAELSTFQEYLRAFVAETPNLVKIEDPNARLAHLDTQYRKTLQPQLEELRKCLRSGGIQTVLGAMNVRLALPPAIAGFAKYLTGPVGSVAAAAGAALFSIVPVIRQKRRALQEMVRSSPSAYLMYTQEELQPSTLASKVRRSARRFAFGV
jgi:hypothetical protein